MDIRYRIRPVVWYRKYVDSGTRLIDWITESGVRVCCLAALACFWVAYLQAIPAFRALGEEGYSAPVFVGSKEPYGGRISTASSVLWGASIPAAIGVVCLGFACYC